MALVLIGFVAFFLFAGAAYVIFTLVFLPGLAEERLGRLEELPEDVGHWRDDVDSPQGRAALEEGMRRQTRLWIDDTPDLLGRERLLQQVRYLARDSDEVLRVEPDVRVRRRRVRA